MNIVVDAHLPSQMYAKCDLSLRVYIRLLVLCYSVMRSYQLLASDSRVVMSSHDRPGW